MLLEQDAIRDGRARQIGAPDSDAPSNGAEQKEFAAPFTTQLLEVTKRIGEQHWRTPSYIYSKTALCLGTSIFVGFVFFRAPLTHQGLQNLMFAIFLLFTIFGQFVQQVMPQFVMQRELIAFVISNIIIEIPWDILMGVIIFFCFYYPVGFQTNAAAGGALHEHGGLLFLLTVQFLLFGSTLSHMVIAGLPDAEVGGSIENLSFTLCLIFCGVTASPKQFSRFWIFMYRLSPFTYLVSRMLSTGLAKNAVTCADNEWVEFSPPSGSTCAQYMSDYISIAGGALQVGNAESTSSCRFCTYTKMDVFLAQVSSQYDQRWREYGISWVFVFFNVAMSILLYWLIRVPKNRGKGKEDMKRKEHVVAEGDIVGEGKKR